MSTPLVIRTATRSDAVELSRLAVLDSAPALHGPALVAELDGHIVAARGLHSGATIADPFVHTSRLLEVLAVHARPERVRRPRVGLGHWTHARTRVA